MAKSSPIVDTSDILALSSGRKIIIHDNRVPNIDREDLRPGDYIIRRSGGYTCSLHQFKDTGRRQWMSVRANTVEALARHLEKNHPDIYATITWSI